MNRRTLITFAIGLTLSAFLPMSADESDRLRTVVDKAIQAVGGDNQISKHATVAWSSKATYYGVPGQAYPLRGEYSVQWPDKYCLAYKGVYTAIRNGDKGWMVKGGETKEMEGQQLAYYGRERYVGWVCTLSPLKDKAFTLSPLEEIKVDDRPATGIKVSRAGRIDVSLYFDQATGRLVKSRHTTLAAEQGFKETDQETYFREYQDMNGIQVAMKTTTLRDGNVYIESEITEYEPIDKFDDAVFSP